MQARRQSPEVVSVCDKANAWRNRIYGMSPSLTEHLSQQLAARPVGGLCVAFSGGADSTALLHALASLPQARARGLRAVHVDHRLQAGSIHWAQHCRDTCAALDVPLTVILVTVEQGSGDGLEASARDARYAAFAEILGQEELIVLAHHRDDQAETVLLKLLRGAGPEGLAGMREYRPFGHGGLWRPLLPLAQAELLAYVAANALGHIEDPSNADPAMARNFLRAEILPRLRRHWPQTVDSIVHSANLSRDAADHLETRWRAAGAALRGAEPGTLDAAGWLALAPALRVPLLAAWLHELGMSAPTTAQRKQLERQIRDAAADRLPRIRWGNTELRLWRGLIWALPPEQPFERQWEAHWQGELLALPGGGTLSLAAPLELALTVRYRRGGERIRPAGDPHTRELRDLFQRGAIPPWLRPRCPLIYAGDELLAVADRWVSERGESVFRQVGGRPHWRLHD
jgi:tRNA(Ile)-lysidine synthase